MKTFYSILYCPIIPEVNENISVGLYLKDDKEFIFRYSKAKLGFIRNMIDREAYHLLQINLKNIERSLAKLKTRIKDSEESLIPIEEINMAGESYFGYLSRSSRNFLSFSKPASIDLEVNQSNFEKLFSKLVYRDEYKLIAAEEKEDKFLTTKSNIKSRTERKVNWHFDVTDQYIPDLLIPVTADFIGKNGHYVSGSFIDFNKKKSSLVNEVAKQFELIRPIKNNDRHSKCFVLSMEPPKTMQEEHKIWMNVYTSDLIDYIDLNDYEKVVEHIESTGTKPLLEFER